MPMGTMVVIQEQIQEAIQEEGTTLVAILPGVAQTMVAILEGATLEVDGALHRLASGAPDDIQSTL